MVHTIFGQLVVGPPGSGKSTYCQYVCDNLRRSGRNVKIINLDPANDSLKYKPAINIMDLITVEQVMDQGKCGPNGAMIHCIETLNNNYGWLYDKLVMLIEDTIKEHDESESKRAGPIEERPEGKGVSEIRSKPYLIFDCPGQSEIYTHHKAMRDIIKKLTANKGKHFDLRLVCMNLCDAYHASDISTYIGIVLNSLSTMINLELPHVNVLSKVDLIDHYGKTRFNLDFYCEVMDLNYLLETDIDCPFFKKYRELSKALAGIIEDYGMVTFIPLNIKKPEDILRVLQLADKANGYYFDDLDLSILQMAPLLSEMA
jgi:GTPase SAR1 family protein